MRTKSLKSFPDLFFFLQVGDENAFVNGAFILKDGETVPNVFPGQGVYGKFKK
ncbi:hypothetical protein NU887_10310 [Aquiflexum sp. XJ19-11]|uniref:Uncharacterized protein n=2 Tax=Aquiflexum gelatinilyticum TaxID=2961943 RepID=A0A9X2P3D2_9BACT|nr:hypothetical protein [Aquiflexum gelatinilyticum]